MQNRELNTCKQDIYSFLHFLLPTNTEPVSIPESLTEYLRKGTKGRQTE